MNETAPAAIRLAGVSKRYGNALALQPTDLEIGEGEFFCLLGPSGCGKTTTLNLIGGFVNASEGEIYIRDRRVDGLPPHRRSVNTVFQSYALFPHMTVRENVGFGLKMARVPSSEARGRIEESLRLVGLEAFADRPPGQLSGGQQQRVAVARAVAGDPAILLADEPTGNLDSVNGESVMELLRELHRNGATICMVTHDPRYAQHADRSVHLFDGRVVEDQAAGHA